MDARAVGLATLDLLRLLARDGPVVVAIDDTQWLDPPSRQTLAYALRRLEREPVSLLTALAPTLSHSHLASSPGSSSARCRWARCTSCSAAG